MKFCSRLVPALAFLSLVLIAGACRPGGELTRYDKTPAAAAGDGELAGELAGGLVLEPADGNWPRSGGRMMAAARDGRVAGMLFDLKSLSGGRRYATLVAGYDDAESVVQFIRSHPPLPTTAP